jgi:type IV pilus assembly protein PilP
VLIKQNNKILLIVILISMALWACSDNSHMQNLRVYITKLKEKTLSHHKETTVLTLKQPAPIFYQANVLRAPFAEQSAFTGSKNIVLNPLQAFSLNMLKLVGTLSDGKVTTAFILAPDSKIYPAKVGDLMGDHNGHVINIYPDRLEVMEENADEKARVTQRIITLQLKEQIR